MSAEIIVEGDELIQQRFGDPEALAAPMRRLLTRAAIAGTNAAKRRARVDTGNMRSSTAYEVDPSFIPVWATIGSNVSYAWVWEAREGWLSGGLEDATPEIERFITDAEKEIKIAYEGEG